MIFVGHCSSVLESFSCNFKGIISTFEKMNTSETILLQERILNLDFVLDYLLKTSIMSYPTFLSKSVQQGSVLPWMFTDNVYSTLKTLKLYEREPLYYLTCNAVLLNKALFPKFHECHAIVVSKEYNSCPLPDIPIAIVSTRIKTVESRENSVGEFLTEKIEAYQEYINQFMQNIEKRFYCGTFEVCKSMGKLFNFDCLIYPNSCGHGLVTNITDFTLKQVSDLIKGIQFAPNSENEIKQLLFEYRQLFKFASGQWRIKRERAGHGLSPMGPLHLKAVPPTLGAELVPVCTLMYRKFDFKL